MRKLAPAAAAVLAMTGAVTIADTGTASAAGWGCSGSEVSDSPYPVVGPAGSVFSYVHLYWNGSTGKNCAVNVKTGALYGTPTQTEIVLYQCAADTPAAGCSATLAASDGGNFAYYAGPASIPGAGHCLVVQAWTDDTSGNEANFARGPFHC
ncbi:hypothetical protein [Kutzneria chonburiensis]|uniref:Spore-associated protein A n=1 Tax=Kutzneria chonburiensis TaxID=1483604 RepID=A0ABV6MS57_9PSEU|nr:hypothetical protein [Kutzneria chonburiensis]